MALSPERSSADSAEELYEHAPCGYLSTAPDGTIAKVNETFLRWTGHSRDEIVGHKRFSELLSAGGRIYHETHVAPLLRMQGAVREIALEIVCADGRRLPVIVNSALKRDDDGNPVLVRTTVFDATERKEYERELLRARDRERGARERTEHLQRVTAVLSGTLSPEQVGAAFLPELAGSTGAAHAVFAVLDDDRLEVLTRHGTADQLPDGLAALESAAPVFGAAFATLPLVAHGRTLGIVWIGLDEEREFAESERAFLAACAGQCALALERAQLHERTAVAARRSAFHAAASRALDEVQAFDERAQRLLDLVVAHVGALAWIELNEDGALVTVAAADRTGTPHEELLSRPREARLSPGAAGAVEQAHAGGGPRVIVEPRPADADAAHSYAVLPLRARRHVLGVLVVARFDPDEPFGDGDLTFLSELADRAGLALENARLYEQQRDVARVLQQSLLAGSPPHDARFEVATAYRSAIETLEVGGDWYDTFTTGTDRLVVVVGDVVGRGIIAASAMGQLRSAVRALAAAGLGPAEVIDRLDVFVDQIEPARCATLVYAEVDLETGATRYACAGHPPPILAAPGEPARLLWDGRSTPLGIRGRSGVRDEAEIVVPPGAGLLLYTDGLVERRGESIDAGLERLAAAYGARAGTRLPALMDELIGAMRVSEQHRDDVCLLCLRLSGDDAEH